jgi:hypothetical protein
MKKIFIVIAVIFVGIAILPFIGNKVVQETVQSRLETLNKYGLTSQLIKKEKGYFQTHLLYHVIVNDEKKFVHYLQQFSSKQLPPYTQSLLEGVTFAIDLEYNNIPLSDKLHVELYPIALSENTMQKLKQNQPKVYAFVTKILNNKELLYHIDYNVVNAEFDGYMKDFHEQLDLDTKEHLVVSFSGLRADGKGVLLAPERLHTSLKEFSLDVASHNDALVLRGNNITSTTNFASDTTYISSLHVGALQIDLKENTQKMQARIENFAVSVSSDTQKKEAQLFVKTHLQHFGFSNVTGEYVLDGFNYDMSIDNMHKENYIKLHKMFETNTQDWDGEKQQQLQKTLQNLLANGLHVKVADFSLKQFAFPNSKDIQGFRSNLDMKLAQDLSMLNAEDVDAKRFTKNITLTSFIELSKPFYSVLNQLYPLDQIVAKYKKEKGDSIIFDIQFKDNLLYINKKQVQ